MIAIATTPVETIPPTDAPVPISPCTVPSELAGNRSIGNATQLVMNAIIAPANTLARATAEYPSGANGTVNPNASTRAATPATRTLAPTGGTPERISRPATHPARIHPMSAPTNTTQSVAPTSARENPRASCRYLANHPR